jgi:ankyrin repeat protein
MVATAAEPRYPPWLRRALAKSAECNRVQSSTDSKRASASSKAQVPAKSAVAFAVSNFPLVADEVELVWDAAARDDVGRISAYVDEHKHRVFARRDLLRRDGGGESLLHVAATHGSVEVMRYLVQFLEANFSHETQRRAVNAVDTLYSRTTPLIAACRSSGGAAVNRLEILKLLVRSGATTTAVDAHGDNVLHWCARKGSAVLLRYFLMETDASGGAAFARNSKRETVS